MSQTASQIKPQLRLFDLTMIVVGLIIGMGIFRTPAEVAQKGQTPIIFFAAWITGAIVSLIGALTFAEIGSRYPVAGGFYKIFSHCYHPAFAFMVNWITVISNAASTAGVAIMGAEYISPIIFPGLEHNLGVKITTISAVLFLFLINLRGIKLSSTTLNVLMAIKLGMILLLISALFFITPNREENLIKVADTNNTWLSPFLACFIPVFFTYGGYQQTMNFGGDVSSPQKTMPRAIFFGIAVVLVFYLVANYSYYKILGFSHLQKTSTIASDISVLMFGSAAGKIISFVMFFCVMAYVNVSMMSNPRVYFAMAEDKVLPKQFMKVNPNTQVQEWALTLFFVFILITLFLSSSFQKILEYVMFFDSISLIAAASAIFVLRHRSKKSGEAKDIYKIFGYPFLPILYILIYAAVNISVMITNPNASFIGFVLFISGLPLFLLIRRLIKKR
jgi:APA family basic amino acid/polyamine antiporter